MAKQSNAAPQKRGFFARLFGRREAVPKTARRSYAGARPVGSLASWQPQNWSADALARSDLDRLRARARSLARDNDYMRKFLNMVESNVIGRDGFALQMRVLLDNAEKPDALANKAIEAAFSRWARRGVCDVTGQMSFTDLQRLLIRSVARDGEVLIRHISGFDNDYGYALQVLDIDRLDTGYNVPQQNGRNAVRMGVELNSYSRPVAYWLRTAHPGESYGQTNTGNLRERVPAEQISHIPARPPGAAARLSVGGFGHHRPAKPVGLSGSGHYCCPCRCIENGLFQTDGRRRQLHAAD